MILITGGPGQVGIQLTNVLKKNGKKFFAPSRFDLNLDDDIQIKDLLSSHEFSGIIHLAAETNVDFCESEQSIAFQRNVKSTQILADHANLNGLAFTFISSSAVLSGDGNFWHDENSDYSPANYYGTTKMLAEKYLIENMENYLILRASWMLGKGSKTKKFAETIREKLLEEQNVQAVFDKFGSLTSAQKLAEVISQNCEHKQKAVVNIASSTACSRYEVAKHIALRVGSSYKVSPVPDALFNLAAPRGFSEGLQSRSSIEKLSFEPVTWELELDSFLEGFN